MGGSFTHVGLGQNVVPKGFVKNGGRIVRPRRKDQLLTNAHNLLMNWVEWNIRYESSSCIGYPSQTIEGRAAKEGGILPPAGRPGAKVPLNAVMPIQVKCVNRAISMMPEMLQWIVRQEYVGTGKRFAKKELFAARYHRPARDYQDVLDMARTYVLATRDNMIWG